MPARRCDRPFWYTNCGCRSFDVSPEIEPACLPLVRTRPLAMVLPRIACEPRARLRAIDASPPAARRRARGARAAASRSTTSLASTMSCATLIVSGQLPPGRAIAERAVVARMGLSRTPVRSALHRLQQEGFVASVGRAGDQRLIVTPLTRGDGREVFLIVGHLEGLAAREAASLPADARKELVRRLREVNRELAVASRAKASPALLFDLDLSFTRRTSKAWPVRGSSRCTVRSSRRASDTRGST